MKQDFTYYKQEPRAVNGGTVLLFAFLSIIAATILYMLLNMVIAETGLSDNTKAYAMLDFCLSAGLPQLGLLTVAIIFSKNTGFKKAAGISKPGVAPGFVMPLTALLTLAAFAPLALAFSAFMEQTGYNGAGIELPAADIWQKIISAAVICILPAICEELIFRGLVLRSLLAHGETLAILVSAAAFSLFHGNPDQTLYQFALGFVMAYAVVRTGSIVSSMIIHFVSNLAVVILEFAKIEMFMPSETVFMMIYAAGLALAGILVITLLIDGCTRKLSSNIFVGRLFKRGKPAERTEINSIKAEQAPWKAQYIIAFGCMAVLWILSLVIGYFPAAA